MAVPGAAEPFVREWWAAPPVIDRASDGGRDGAGRWVGPRPRRRHFLASEPSECCLHDHVAWCGDGPESLDRLSVAAFSSAAKRGELMVLVSERPDPGRLVALEDVEGLMDRGALRLATVDAVYGGGLDVAAQRAVFEDLVDGALAEGYTGVCVVADNSRSAAGTDEEFAAWLNWEATADRLEAARPVTGICYFDRRAVSSDRLADLAAMHPVLSIGFEAPSFQLFVDVDAVRVVGALEAVCAEQLTRVLHSAPALTELVLDLSGADFIDHRALLVLNRAVGTDRVLRLRGAKAIVRRVWDLLDVANPALEFC